MIPRFIVPEWPAPPNVRAATTLRNGGASRGPWASLNLGTHVGDQPERVAANRRGLSEALALPAEPAWLDQVHGTRIVRLDAETVPALPRADGATTARAGRPLVVMTADCVPVLLCRRDGRRVGVAHAGWRAERRARVSELADRVGRRREQSAWSTARCERR